jgi:hypothetical protein
MLLLSVCDRMQDSTTAGDRKRLNAFLGNKDAGGKVVSLKSNVSCCG